MSWGSMTCCLSILTLSIKAPLVEGLAWDKQNDEGKTAIREGCHLHDLKKTKVNLL